MLFPVIQGPFSNRKHAIKNAKVTECGIPYPDFFETIQSARKAILFKEIQDITCTSCKEKIENLI